MYICLGTFIFSILDKNSRNLDFTDAWCKIMRFYIFTSDKFQIDCKMGVHNGNIFWVLQDYTDEIIRRRL